MVVQQIATQAPCGQMTRDADGLDVQTLHVISLAAPERPLLSLLVGPPTRETRVVRGLPRTCATSEPVGCIVVTHCGGVETAPAFTWTWSVACSASSCTLGVGPVEEVRAGRAAAVFRWGVPAEGVQGPPGSADGGFLTYDVDDASSALDAFTAGHGFPITCDEAGDEEPDER